MKKINSGEVEFKLVGKGTYWEVRQKVYLFGLIPYWSKFYWELTSGEDTPPNQWHLLV